MGLMSILILITAVVRGKIPRGKLLVACGGVGLLRLMRTATILALNRRRQDEEICKRHFRTVQIFRRRRWAEGDLRAAAQFPLFPEVAKQTRTEQYIRKYVMCG